MDGSSSMSLLPAEPAKKTLLVLTSVPKAIVIIAVVGSVLAAVLVGGFIRETFDRKK